MLEFKLVVNEIPVRLEDANGVKADFVIRELTGTTRDQYLDKNSDRMNYNDAGKPCGIKSYDGIQSSLLEVTLVDSEGNFVPKAVLQAYPSSVLGSLYEESQKLSGLDEEAKETVKND